MPNSLHTNKIKDEKDAFVNELFNMIPKREELISGEASAIATQIHKLYLTIYIMNYFKSQKLKTDYYEYLLSDILSQIDPKQFEDAPLSGKFVLGFHAQLHDLKYGYKKDQAKAEKED